MTRRQRTLGAIVLAIAVVSCSGDGTAPQGASCSDQTSSVDATISVGTSVTFNWTPACPVALVLIEPANSGDDVWWIATFPSNSDIAPTTENRITPPVTFGQVPSTATDSFGPKAMLAGSTYKLVLWRNLPTGSALQCQYHSGTGCVVALKTFTR
jgi:hypothetical protein